MDERIKQIYVDILKHKKLITDYGVGAEDKERYVIGIYEGYNISTVIFLLPFKNFAFCVKNE